MTALSMPVQLHWPFESFIAKIALEHAGNEVGTFDVSHQTVLALKLGIAEMTDEMLCRQ